MVNVVVTLPLPMSPRTGRSSQINFPRNETPLNTVWEGCGMIERYPFHIVSLQTSLRKYS